MKNKKTISDVPVKRIKRNFVRVPVKEAKGYSVRFGPDVYEAVRQLAKDRDISMQTVINDAVVAYIDYKQSGSRGSYPDFGKITPEERLLVKTVLDMHRNAESTDREILVAIANWWRRKWQ